MGLALRTAFTHGVSAVYRVALFIALVTLLLPEQRLRRRHRQVSPLANVPEP